MKKLLLNFIFENQLLFFILRQFKLTGKNCIFKIENLKNRIIFVVLKIIVRSNFQYFCQLLVFII